MFSFSQRFELEQNKHVQKLKFQLINNVVVIPIEVNGSKLSFILDTGVSSPILFNLSGQDSVQINDVSEVEIRGLGKEKSITALSSKGNIFKINKIKNNKQDLFVVLDKDINFSTTFGIPVHGIIGYDLFRDFVVDINNGPVGYKVNNLITLLFVKIKGEWKLVHEHHSPENLPLI